MSCCALYSYESVFITNSTSFLLLFMVASLTIYLHTHIPTYGKSFKDAYKTITAIQWSSFLPHHTIWLLNSIFLYLFLFFAFISYLVWFYRFHWYYPFTSYPTKICISISWFRYCFRVFPSFFSSSSSQPALLTHLLSVFPKRLWIR